MLNRRHLRLKALQGLYMYLQSDIKDIRKVENEILKSSEKIVDLYLHILSIFTELLHQGCLQIERNKQKRLPTKEDLNPNLKFVHHSILIQLEENKLLKTLLETKKINWLNDQELMRKFYKSMTESDTYVDYMSNSDESYQKDKDFLIEVFSSIIATSDTLEHLLEEKNIFWYDDINFVYSKVVQTIEKIHPKLPESEIIYLSAFKDEDDKDFLKILLLKSIENISDYEELIKVKAENWEYDRIALVDRILLILGITELTHFPSIPVKVTLNEYIDLAKEYSTDKSNQFVNGLLDKIVVHLTKNGKVNKTGRGLMQ